VSVCVCRGTDVTVCICWICFRRRALPWTGAAAVTTPVTTGLPIRAAADPRQPGLFVCLCVCVCVCSRASVFVSKVLVINRAILSGGTGKMEATTKTNKTTTTTKLPIRAAADPRQPGVSLVCECV